MIITQLTLLQQYHIVYTGVPTLYNTKRIGTTTYYHRYDRCNIV